MSGAIRTVLGDIAPEKLGWCQCHEHAFLEKGKSWEVHKALCLDDYAKSLAELMEYKAAGGAAYVDAQPVGAGRMAERMEQAARETGLHIIASTGFHKTCFYPEESFLFSAGEDALAGLFISEIEEGMHTSDGDGGRRIGAKAGIVKVAVDRGGVFADAVYEKIFRAALAAAGKTGAAVLAHFESGTDAFELLRLMEEYGLAPERLLACHLDRARHDAAYHSELAQAGAYLEYDTINRLKYFSNEKEIELILAMLREGHLEKLLFSLDTTNERLRAYGADMGMDFILTSFAPMLKAAGVSQETLGTIMIANPRRAIAIQRP